VQGGRPALGVIYVPVKGVSSFSVQGGGAFRVPDGGEPEGILVSVPGEGEALRVVASRSHGTEALEEFLSGISIAERVSAGSSLKFCLVAEGSAHIYPRFGPTWEWDTAAGHAIVIEAGGRVTETGDREELRYNKEILKHGGFIAASPSLLDRLSGRFAES